MDFDFNLILVPITLILGFIWLGDILIFKQRTTKGKGLEPAPINWAYDFFPILAVVLIVRSFIFEPFNIPSSSMVPTLYTGDFILVNKYSYGIRIPLAHTKIIDIGMPKYGDVVVFRYPVNPKQYFIKRVVGLPGDRVSYNQGVVSVNGQPIPLEESNFIANEELTKQLYTPIQESKNNIGLDKNTAIERGVNEERDARYYQEQHGSHKHLVRYLHDFAIEKNFDTSWEQIVPEDHYFMMGDNRDRSSDSRFWGFVPEKNLAGKAIYIWTHKKPGMNIPTFNRNGSIQ